MAGVNKAIILGRLGKDPEVRYTGSGGAVANLSVATSEAWNDKASGERKERTEWHKIVVFGKMAENCGKYLQKGRQVYVEGRIQTSEYEKDGEKRYSTDIVANSVQFIGSKSEDSGGGGYQQKKEPSQPQTMGGFKPKSSGGPEPDDDIPF